MFYERIEKFLFFILNTNTLHVHINIHQRCSYERVSAVVSREDFLLDQYRFSCVSIEELQITVVCLSLFL